MWSHLLLQVAEICIDEILKKLDGGNRTCSCGVNCEETQYEVKLSSSDWPSQDYVVMMISMILLLNKKHCPKK